MGSQMYRCSETEIFRYIHVKVRIQRVREPERERERDREREREVCGCRWVGVIRWPLGLNVCMHVDMHACTYHACMQIRMHVIVVFVCLFGFGRINTPLRVKALRA